MDTWRLGLLRKFPTLDLTWPADVQARWFRVFRELLALKR
jgi:hypothetical protein